MMWTIVFCNFLWICSVWCATLKFEHERIGKDTASQRVKVRSITRRSVDGIRTLHLSAFGKDHVLQLKPSEIFTPDFEFLQASRAPDGNLEFTKIEVNQKKHSNSEGKLYTVNEGKGSVYITNDATLKVEGLISNELRIAPEEDDWFEDGSLAHYVHQIETHNYFQQADYLIPDPSDNSFQHISFAAENVPDEITVEVLVVFDHANSKRLEFNLDKIRKYVGIFWSQINYRYRDTANPKINVAVSGLLTFTNPEDEPFIFKHRYDGDRVDKECLGSFKNWLKDSFTSLPKHDAAILQLGLDAGRWLNGSWDYTYAGLAYVGTACSTSGTSSGFAEDRAPQFGGFMAAAHELGHVLNCPHDGTGAAKECPSGGGFIMSGGSKKTFSTCSLEIMQKFVLSDKRNCLKDTPIIGVPLIDVWPVLMVEDLNEQCQLMFKNKDYFFPGKINAGVCEKMWCGKKNSGVRYLLRGAYDGTPCGFNKVCLDKKCVDMPASSVDKQCQMGFGIQYKASVVESICQNVQCSDSQTGEEKSLGTPLPGTLCGTRNICLNGKCYAV